jgi:hypothetical protein
MDEPQGQQSRDDSLRRFRAASLRLSGAAAIILAGAAYYVVGEDAAAGVLLGSIAGVVGFRLLSGRVERLSSIPPQKLHAAMIAGTYARLTVYAVFLAGGYYLDPVTLHGFFGALAGILLIRFVHVYAAVMNARRARAR